MILMDIGAQKKMIRGRSALLWVLIGLDALVWCDEAGGVLSLTRPKHCYFACLPCFRFRFFR